MNNCVRSAVIVPVPNGSDDHVNDAMRVDPLFEHFQHALAAALYEPVTQGDRVGQEVAFTSLHAR